MSRPIKKTVPLTGEEACKSCMIKKQISLLNKQRSSIKGNPVSVSMSNCQQYFSESEDSELELICPVISVKIKPKESLSKIPSLPPVNTQKTLSGAAKTKGFIIPHNNPKVASKSHSANLSTKLPKLNLGIKPTTAIVQKCPNIRTSKIYSNQYETVKPKVQSLFKVQQTKIEPIFDLTSPQVKPTSMTSLQPPKRVRPKAAKYPRTPNILSDLFTKL